MWQCMQCPLLSLVRFNKKVSAPWIYVQSWRSTGARRGPCDDTQRWCTYHAYEGYATLDLHARRKAVPSARWQIWILGLHAHVQCTRSCLLCTSRWCLPRRQLPSLCNTHDAATDLAPASRSCWTRSMRRPAGAPQEWRALPSTGRRAGHSLMLPLRKADQPA